MDLGMYPADFGSLDGGDPFYTEWTENYLTDVFHGFDIDSGLLQDETFLFTNKDDFDMDKSLLDSPEKDRDRDENSGEDSQRREFNLVGEEDSEEEQPKKKRTSRKTQLKRSAKKRSTSGEKTLPGAKKNCTKKGPKNSAKNSSKSSTKK